MIDELVHNIEELKIVLDQIPGSATFDFSHMDYKPTDRLTVVYMPSNNCVYFS